MRNVWLAVASCLLLATIWFGASAFVRLGRAARSLQDIDRERRALSDLRTALDDAQSAERSALLRDDGPPGAWKDARAAWNATLAAVKGREPSVERRALLDAVDAIARPAFDHMRETMRAASGHGDLAARLLAEDTQLAEARRRIAAMQADEKELASTTAALEGSRQRSLFVAFLVGVLVFAALASVAVEARRRESKRRVQAEERAALLDVADQFIGVLGHDLRNPMSAVLMAGKLLTEHATGQLERSLAARVVSSSSRAFRMIDDMLDLARTRLGDGIPVMRTRGDLRDIVANVIDELRTAHGPRIRWRWHGEGTGEWDSDRMAQAISNVVANALQHGPPDGVVEVRLRGDASTLELAVHNGGEPIPSSRLPTLFESYRDRGSDARRHGLGLGLFITRQIVQAHDGTVNVRSSSVDGTTFTLAFPRETVSRSGGQEAPPEWR